MEVGGGSVQKKGMGVRPWLVVDSSGQAQVVEAGKQAIMRRTGLPARDLRILDPLLSYPSTVLGRERAIVINLEHIKAIITAQEVLLLNYRDPYVTPFIDELQRRLSKAMKAQESNGTCCDLEEAEAGEEAKEKKKIHHEGLKVLPFEFVALEIDELQRRHSKAMKAQESNGKCCDSEEAEADEEAKVKKCLHEGLTVLPFEFVALEACLEAACNCLENEARTLEQETHPALDKLTSKIATLSLELVRQIKSRLVAITGRVQKVRDDLEHLLDDDNDMAEMYLTEKLQLENSNTSSLSERDNMNDEAPETNTDYPTGSTDSVTGKDDVNVKELEMLLEAYFVQIDGTLNKLSTLREYVDDTEDYINIMLDDKQNHLLQMGVMLTIATLVVSAFEVVAGIFGMNIHIDLFDSSKAGMRDFLWTCGGSTMGSVFLYIIAIGWCKYKRLLE